MDASGRGRLLHRLADLIERDRLYLAVSIKYQVAMFFYYMVCFLLKYFIYHNLS